MAAAAPESDVIARALDCLAMEDWPAAHRLVQELDSPLAYWVHALVHQIEGDAHNSRYWYQKAGATAMGSSARPIKAQIAEIRQLLCTAERS